MKGHIDERWSAWLDGLTIRHGESDETVLTGPVVDQAALYGLIAKLRDLGLPLLAVNPVQAELQADLATLSSNGRQVLAKDSRRHIQIDQPESVTDAIREVV